MMMMMMMIEKDGESKSLSYVPCWTLEDNDDDDDGDREKWRLLVPVLCAMFDTGGYLFVGCSTSQQQASVSQRRICSDNFTCCHTEIDVADPTFYLTQSQYTDTGPTSPSADPITPGAWQGSHRNDNFESLV